MSLALGEGNSLQSCGHQFLRVEVLFLLKCMKSASHTFSSITYVIVATINHPPKSIESLGDGSVDVGPHVLWQEVLVHCQVSCQVTLP